jgi:hypothetical protein
MGLESRTAVFSPVGVVARPRRRLVPVVAWFALGLCVGGCSNDPYFLSVILDGGGDGTIHGGTGTCTKTGNARTGDCSIDGSLEKLNGRVIVAEAAPGSTFAGWAVGSNFCFGGALDPICAVTGTTFDAQDQKLVAVFEKEAVVDIQMLLDPIVAPSWQGSGQRRMRAVTYADDAGDAWCMMKDQPGVDLELPEGSPLRLLPGEFPDCIGSWASGTQVTLKTYVKATIGAELVATHVDWTGACVGRGPTCTFTATPGRAEVTATVVPEATATSPLTILGGGGDGKVTSAPAGIDCTLSGAGAGTGTCTADLVAGTAVTLTAQPAAGFTLQGVSLAPMPTGAACTGATCTYTPVVGQAVTATATFAPISTPTRRLTVAGGLSGTRAGTVTSDVGGIDCVPLGSLVEGTCTADVALGTVVTLTVTPAIGYGFTSLAFAPAAPDCTSSPCPVTVDADTTATVTFTAIPMLMQEVRLNGPMAPGSGGEVTVVSGGGTCDNTGSGKCTFPVSIHTPCWCQTPTANTLVLRATPISPYTFTGFTAGCSATAPSPAGVVPPGVDCTVDPAAALVSGELTGP